MLGLKVVVFGVVTFGADVVESVAKAVEAVVVVVDIGIVSFAACLNPLSFLNPFGVPLGILEL